MRLDGCVRRDDKMEFRGNSCMLYVQKHRDTFSETMSVDAHNMMMRVFMGSMTPRGSIDLQMSLQSSLTREGLGGVRALKIHTRTYGSYVGKYYTSIVVRDWRPPLDEIEIGPKSMIACVCICMAPYNGVTYGVFFKILRPCATSFFR